MDAGRIAASEARHHFYTLQQEIVMNSASSSRSLRKLWTPIAFSISGLIPALRN
jgi:hypothetical protein